MASESQKVLVQITEETFNYSRVPIGTVPFVELHLEPNQRVISCRLSSLVGATGRVTEDWWARVQIETRLEATDA